MTADNYYRFSDYDAMFETIAYYEKWYPELTVLPLHLNNGMMVIEVSLENDCWSKANVFGQRDHIAVTNGIDIGRKLEKKIQEEKSSED